MTFDVAARFTAVGAAEAARDVAPLAQAVDRLVGGFARAAHYGVGLFAVVPAIYGLSRALADAADQVTVMHNRLALATGSAAAATKAYEQLFSIAQASRASFTELGATYATLARAGEAMGVGQARLMTVTQAIGQAMAISGGSADGMRAALVQLGQGLSAGVLRGEELNSVMEQAPRLARALADGLGVPIGQLRVLGEQGALTAEKVMQALEASAPRLAKEIAGSTVTVSQAFTVLGNSATRFVGEADGATGASKALAGAIQILATGIGSLASVIRENETTFAVLGGTLAGAGVIAGVGKLAALVPVLTGAVAALGVALAANPAVLALLGIGAAVGAGVAALRAHSRTKEGIEESIDALQRLNEMSQKAFDNAAGRPGAQDNIRKTMEERTAQVNKLRQELALLGAQGLDTRAEDARFEASTAAFNKRAKLQADVIALSRELSGVDETYVKRVELLSYALEAGAISQARFNELRKQAFAQMKDGKKQQEDALKAMEPYVKERDALREQNATYGQGEDAVLAYRAAKEGLTRQTAKLLEEIAAERAVLLAKKAATDAEREAQEAAFKARERAGEQAAKHADDLRELVKRQREENLQLSMTAAQYRNLGLERLREQLRLAELVVQQDEYLQMCTAETEAHKDTVEALRELTEARGEGARLQGAKDASEEMAKFNADWQRSVEQMGQSLSDALMNGGKSASDYLKGLFRNLVLRPILMPITGAISSFISGPAAAAGGGGGGSALGSGVSGLLGSALGGIGAFGGALAGGATATLSGVGLGGLMSGAGSMIGMGSVAGVAGGVGLAIGAIAPYALAALGAYAIGKKLFGRKHKDSGIEGSFDASGDFSGNSFDFYKGGTFRRDKTKRGALDSGTESVLDAGAAAMAAATRSYAEVLGLPVKAIEGYSQQIKLSLKGLNEDQVKQAIEGAVQGFGEGMAARFGVALSTFQRAGETMGQTLERLAGLQAFSNTLSDLGGVFERIAGLGIDAREGLIQLAGGIEAMGQKALQFVQDYYSRDEIAGLKAGEIQDALQAVGITQDINSRDEYRALLDSLDVSTETGRQQFAAMLDMAQAFTGVADYLTEAGRTLSQAAAGAPQSNGATALFAQGGAADQVLAINNVGFWTERVFQAIKEQTAIIAGGAAAAVALPTWSPEVNGAAAGNWWAEGPTGGA